MLTNDIFNLLYFVIFFSEYLDEEYIEENESDDLIMESILPAIKKTIATKSGIHLDSQTKYKVFRKPGNEIEVECRTSDGKIFSIEMMIDNPTNSVRFNILRVI